MLTSFATPAEFARSRVALPEGVIGIVLCDSSLHAEASARRMFRQGAGCVVTLGLATPLRIDGHKTIAITSPLHEIEAHRALNTLIDALDGRWLLWHWNAEFFVFPYGETRSIADLAAFLTDERRRALYCYALDLYSRDLPRADQAPELAELNFDRLGYYAFPKENQQLRVFGGLGWRFQEFLPPRARQIGRTSVFRAEKGAHLGRDMMFEDPDLASVACPWHHNPTGAVMSLRRARAIMAHAAFPEVAKRLYWRGTTRFDWTSSQLLNLGLIEPGQWF